MAKVDTAKQIATIDALKVRVQSILDDLDLLRKNIEESDNNVYTPSSANGVTLNDVLKELDNKKHKSSRFKLRELCKDNNINSLDDFLKISPSAFERYKGIGPTTAYHVRKAIEGLGVVWSDAT